MNAYYRDNERGFANEYTIHVATDADYRKIFEDAGYERIIRKEAIRKARYRGDAVTQAFIGRMIDCVPCWNFADWFSNL